MTFSISSRFIFFFVSTVVCLSLAPKALYAEHSPILHENIPLHTESSRDHSNETTPPLTIEHGSHLIPRPSFDESPQVPKTSPSRYEPDRQTTQDHNLKYSEVFNPSIVPFKRSQALNAIDSDAAIFLESGEMRPLDIQTSALPHEKLFWGSLTIEVGAGQKTQCPSVSASMKIVSIETHPPTLLRFYKDEADNVFAEAPELSSPRSVTLRFLASSPESYFSPALNAPGPPLSEGSKQHLPTLPPRLKEMGRKAARQLGIGNNDGAVTALKILVKYLRAFDATQIAPQKSHIFWDLFSRQMGVCRHRAYVFFVIANAIGIPARYLFNEAHAWVEVWLPETDWFRIDLGGAANTLDLTNVSDKLLYRPPDLHFEKPQNYQSTYTQLQGEVNGLHSRHALTDGEGSEELSTDSYDSIAANPLSRQGQIVDPSLPPLENKAHKNLKQLSIKFTHAPKVGYRGLTLRLQGQANNSQGQGVANIAIDLFILPEDAAPGESILLFQTETDSRGIFDVDVELSRDLAIESYGLYASSPGNGVYRPALSQ